MNRERKTTQRLDQARFLVFVFYLILESEVVARKKRAESAESGAGLEVSMKEEVDPQWGPGRRTSEKEEEEDHRQVATASRCVVVAERLQPMV